MAVRPSRRDEFEIAVVCALPLEFDAAALAFDEFWDDEGDTYGKAPGDTNSYTTGRIGPYNVVLSLLSTMGKVSAAGAASSLRSSYTGLRLALLTGICGGVPNPRTDDEVLLGDVVVSKTVVQYDYGRQYPGAFVRRDTVDDNLGRPNKDIRALVESFRTDLGRERLHRGASLVLGQIRENAAKKRRRARYNRPDASEDTLFEPGYEHKHRDRSDCECGGGEHACEAARAAACSELRCDTARLVRRDRLDDMFESEPADHFEIHVGCVGSGDMVMKSGLDRDRIARDQGLIAFEMEGAGMWDEVPCIVVKGVCDYADSHKNKKWQTYAAATAASVMKALLGRYIQTDRPPAGDRNETDQSSTPSAVPATPSGVSGPVFHGPITGKHVVAGQHTSGGTTNMNFGG